MNVVLCYMKTLFIGLFSFFHTVFPSLYSTAVTPEIKPTVVVSPSPTSAPKPTLTPTVIPPPKSVVGFMTGNVGGDNGPMTGYSVKIYRQDGTVAGSGVTNGTGYFSIAVPPGSYYWIQNEAGSNRNGSIRRFSVIAGQKAYDIFAVNIDSLTPFVMHSFEDRVPYDQKNAHW